MEKFFIHLPYSQERGLGCKAWGISAEYILHFPLSKHHRQETQDWLNQHTGKTIFTIISYEAGFHQLGIDLKNKPLQPALLFIIPQKIEWLYELEPITEPNNFNILNFKPKETEEQYLNNLSIIRKDLLQGNYYETNYCTQLLAELKNIDLYEHWKQLYFANPAPFAAYVHWNEHHLLCLSPERFLKKEGQTLISQPIKGTIKRGIHPEQDIELKNKLISSEKDNTENTMIVDLVRNDLSKIATKGSVQVTEKCKPYTFPKLHHLISTITCDIDAQASFTQIIEALFPMGSMTGVPKKRAVETMHLLEPGPRGWYSGTLGIIHENGDFDLNVIIRSIYCNSKSLEASIGIGGAITLHSDFKDEYQECWLKAQSLINP